MSGVRVSSDSSTMRWRRVAGVSRDGPDTVGSWISVRVWIRPSPRCGWPSAARSPGPAEGGTVIVALSGGADSLALAAATAFEARKLGMRVVAVTVDHGLQPRSAEAAATAAEHARTLGLEARVISADVGARADPKRPPARRATALGHGRSVSSVPSAVLVGHTLDDQAETVLLGLARGSGAASLQGMAPASELAPGVALLRPLLGVRRAITRAACAAEGLQPWDDPHNVDPALRARPGARRVLPVLETELGPGIAEALARTADPAARRRRSLRRDDRRDHRRHRGARRGRYLGVGRRAGGEPGRAAPPHHPARRRGRVRSRA